jgi:RHS repeat-associated protein
VDYVIDGRNTRVGKKVNGVLTQGWLYDQAGRITAELGPMNQVVSIFVYGSRRNAPDYMLKGAATYRFVTDLLGSVRLVIDAQTGAIVQRIDYDPFGDVILDTQQGFQPFGVAGGLYDPDTRLVRFGARDLDPRTGRWTASDPLLHRSGDANLYAYTANDPVNVRDPEGENELVELEAGMTIADVVAATEAAEAAVTQAMLKNMVSGCVSGAVWEAAESGRLGWNVLGACARDGAVGAFTGYAGKWAEEFAKGMDSEVGKWALGCFVNGSMQVAEDFMSTDANSAPQSVPRHVLIQAAMGCVSADFAEVEEYDSAFLKLMKQRQNPWYGRLIGAFQDVIWEGTARIVEGIIDIAVDGKTP